jgi:hypothetical protein
VVPITDVRVNPIFRHQNDRSGFRGCDRENYAQIGDAWNAGGPTMVWTDPMGNQVSASAPNALLQRIPARNLIGHLSTADNRAFKVRKDYCGTSAERARLGLKN